MKFKGFIKQHTKNSLLTKNFIKVMAIILVLLIVSIYIIYQNSINIFNQEFAQTNFRDVQRMTDLSDSVLKETQTIASQLSLSSNAQLYMIVKDPTDIVSEFEAKFKGEVSMFPLIYNYIDSVYVYSELNNTVFSSGGNVLLQQFYDSNWYDEYKKNDNNIEVFTRNKEDRYPFLISIIKRVNLYGNKGAIIINIDIRRLGAVIDGGNDSLIERYIIDKDNLILYENGMESLGVSVDKNLPLLEIAKSSEDAIVTKVSGENYVVAKSKSKYYDWSYICLTKLGSYNEKMENTRNFIILMIFLLLAGGVILAYLFSTIAYKPVKRLVDVLDDPKKWTSQNNIRSSSEIKYIAEKIINTIHTNEDLKNELQSRLNSLSKAQLYALQSQINPHFLYNTLNLIGLKISDEMGFMHPCADMINSVAELMRYALDSEEDTITIQKELKYTKIYVDILSQRYQSFKVVFDIPSELNYCRMPKLCFQPIIENSVFHGFGTESDDKGIIKVYGKKEDEVIKLIIEDNGDGMEFEQLEQIRKGLENEDMIQSRHIGVQNVGQRIRLMYGRDYGVEIDSEKNKGTIVTIKLPYVE